MGRGGARVCVCVCVPVCVCVCGRVFLGVCLARVLCSLVCSVCVFIGLGLCYVHSVLVFVLWCVLFVLWCYLVSVCVLHCCYLLLNVFFVFLDLVP